ncbi:MAG: NAD(P)H-dependent oxidoreductase subunit E [Spirochaetales bacterium]|nr:NAD(P)H-dependent oxidoreductase subunit E [Spirochaetales bacterium]
MKSISTIVKEAVSRNGNERDKLLPVLQDVVKSQNYLSEDALREIAASFKISAAEVYGVATFYSFIDVSRQGQNTIRICKTISCDLKGKDEIIKAIEKKLRIKLGETTPDQKFTFLSTNCIGWCHESPAMLINDKVYTNLNPESAIKAIEEWF